MRRDDDDDDGRPAPPTVVAAVAVGTAPVPFLAIYAVLFIVHGSVHPVIPPDITDSQNGELLAGIIAAVVFVVSVTSLLWAMSGRRRWPFALVQAALLGTSLWFLVDGTQGGTLASVAIALTAAAGLVLILLPASWSFYRPSFSGPSSPTPRRARSLRARRAPAGSAPLADPALTSRTLAGHAGSGEEDPAR